MTAGDNDGLPVAVESLSSASPYEEAMTALSSLITKRSRADTSNKGQRFDLLFEYLKILELEDPISKMKIIHVAGTKGKGSTCVFTESILRNCGFHTGLFTSPHLIDIRERFRLDGVDICEEKFLAYFWWCYDRLKEKVTDVVPMPTYFRFLALLAFKIFASEQVDVAILEVGLGGKFDATNVVQSPVVCGITSLGYDHMEILGNTLGEIAGQKAGIFKHGVPALTVRQPDEAMQVLEDTAAQLDVNLRVVAPLDAHSLNDIQLGLGGEHQFVNAGLAVALCSTWLHKTGHLEFPYMDQMTSLPEQFIQGLVTASLQGRAQIVHDEYVSDERSGDLAFYLDGAHTPESMEVCARWFSHTIKKEGQYPSSFAYQPSNNSGVSHELASRLYRGTGKKSSTQILLFNCMSVRDPQLLLPSLMNSCATQGVHFKQALFVPNISFYHKVITHVPSLDPQVDLSWQLNLQRLWETLTSQKGAKAKDLDSSPKEPRDGIDMYVKHDAHSKVFPTLPSAIKWLRESVKQNQSIRFQVLVTGSLHLVGDVLRLIKK